MNRSQTLRAAATRIREVAAAANTDEARLPYGDRNFTPVAPEKWGDLVFDYLGGAIGAHASVWTPGLAVAVAALLESAALTVETQGPWDWHYGGLDWPMDCTGSIREEIHHALVIAELIVGADL